MTQTSSTGEICRRWPSLAPGALALEGDDAAARAHPAPRHVLAERGHRQRQRDLRLGDVGAAAVAAQEQAFADELVDHGAQRRPRHAQVASPAGARTAARRRPAARRASPGSRRGRAPACCPGRWCAPVRSSTLSGAGQYRLVNYWSRPLCAGSRSRKPRPIIPEQCPGPGSSPRSRCVVAARARSSLVALVGSAARDADRRRSTSAWSAAPPR